MCASEKSQWCGEPYFAGAAISISGILQQIPRLCLIMVAHPRYITSARTADTGTKEVEYQCSRICGSLDISQSYEPVRPVIFVLPYLNPSFLRSIAWARPFRALLSKDSASPCLNATGYGSLCFHRNALFGNNRVIAILREINPLLLYGRTTATRPM
jgi:hypothetical protein